MPGGDKLLKPDGSNGEYSGNFRNFAGDRLTSRYCYAPFAPDDQPPSKRPRFYVKGDTPPRRTSESITACVTQVERARASVQNKATVRTLSIMYLSGLGPDLVPYDTMHFFHCNVVSTLWQLFTGENEKLGEDQPCLIPKTVCGAIDRKIKAGRPSVPLSQARSWRDIYQQSGSYKAVDWIYFLLNVGEVVLSDRIPEQLFKMLMFLCEAGRLLFKTRVFSKEGMKAAEKLLKRFFHTYFRHVYAGTV